MSRQIFVLDPLLVPYAREIFRAQADRIAFITFGVPPKRPLGHSSQQINRRIIEFCQSARGATTEPDRKVLIGVCVGQGGRKSAHFEFVLPLVNRAAAIGIDVYLIVGGEIVLPDSFLCDADIQALRCHPRIFFHSGPFDFDEGAVAGQVDFIFRGYRDLSVPYTLYIGAHSALPILALSMGFAAEAVTKYHLGVTLRPDFQDLGPALSCLQNWDTATGSSFLRSHTWDVAAKNLLAALDQHTFPFREPRNTP